MADSFGHPVNVSKAPFNWVMDSFDFDGQFDLANFQFDSLGNLSTFGAGLVNEAIDLSPSRRHARQRTSGANPTFTGSALTFDGGDSLVFDEVSLTEFTLYCVFKNTGTLSKILAGALSAGDFIMHDSANTIQLKVNTISKLNAEAGIDINKRYVILSIRRKDNDFLIGVDDRLCYIRTNTFAGQPTLLARLMTYVSGGFAMTGGMKAFCLSSRKFEDNTHTKSVNYLYSKHGLALDNAAMTVSGLGDSNMFGTGSTSCLVALATLLGVCYTQLGISGSYFTNVGNLANNGFGRFSSQLITRPFTDYIVIQYGTNDVLGGVSSSIYGEQLDAKIAELISAGHPPSKICLVSVPYQKLNANAAALDNYRTEILAVATARGTKYWDLLQWMRDNGADTLFPSDNVHYGQATQDAMSTNVYTQFTT